MKVQRDGLEYSYDEVAVIERSKMDRLSLIATIVVSLFGSGGIVLWTLNRIALKNDERSCFKQDIKEIKRTTHRTAGSNHGPGK